MEISKQLRAWVGLTLTRIVVKEPNMRIATDPWTID
jgi:hypothetical protein